MTENKKELVLITGANGFVGSRLSRYLLNQGYDVIAGIRRGCNISLIKDLNLPYRYGDITQPDTLPEMVAGVDYIVHNAGLVKARHPGQFLAVNRDGTANLVRAAAGEKRLRKFILISSMAAAGPSERDRARTENDTPTPITEYGRSKLAGEREVLSYKDKINSVILRPSGIYGPGDIEMFSFFQMLHNRLRPYLGDWNRKIQLLHVDDLSRAVGKSLPANTPSGSAYFIAESQSYTLRELIGYLRRAVGRAAFPVYIPGWLLQGLAAVSERSFRAWGKTPMFTREKASELLADWEIDTGKAARELDFKAQISFPEGARETYYWYREEGWL